MVEYKNSCAAAFATDVTRVEEEDKILARVTGEDKAAVPQDNGNVELIRASFMMLEGTVRIIDKWRGLVVRQSDGSDVFLWLDSTSDRTVGDVVNEKVEAGKPYILMASDGSRSQIKGYRLKK